MDETGPGTHKDPSMSGRLGGWEQSVGRGARPCGGRGLGHTWMHVLRGERQPLHPCTSPLRSTGALPVGLGPNRFRKGWKLGFHVKSLRVLSTVGLNCRGSTYMSLTPTLFKGQLLW